MCGIVGVISKKAGGLFTKDLDLFETGLVIDTIRGKDSVGAFTAFKNKQAMAIKHGSNPFEMFKTKEWSTFKSDSISRGRFVIGHNRASTIGATNTDNAHPFVEENIILVHNGTIHNQEQLTKTVVEVDSNAIAHALVENEPQDVFPWIMGAYACVWYDTVKAKLFMIRNDQRPLNLIDAGDTWLVASEPWMMAMPAQRQDRKLGDMICLEPGSLYAFDMEGKYEVTPLDMSKKGQRPGAATTKSGMNVYTADGALTTLAPSKPDEIKSLEEALTKRNDDFFETGATTTESTSPESRTLLRQALVAQRQKKLEQQTKMDTTLAQKPSTSCALTSKVEPSTLISTIGKGSTSNLIDMNEESNLIDGGRANLGDQSIGWAGPTRQCHPTDDDRGQLFTTKDIIDSPMYPVGRVVLFRILSTSSNFQNRTRFMGKLMEPGMEMVDVVGFVPKGTMYAAATVCLGQIFFTKVSVHGVEIFLTDIERCEWTNVHSTEVPLHIWNIAYRECVCEECDMDFRMVDKPFTSVKTKAVFNKTKSGHPINTISCVCADCLTDKIPEGPYRETFIAKRRNIKAANANLEIVRSATDPRPPLQNRKPFGEGAFVDNDGIIRVPSSPSVH